MSYAFVYFRTKSEEKVGCCVIVSLMYHHQLSVIVRCERAATTPGRSWLEAGGRREMLNGKTQKQHAFLTRREKSRRRAPGQFASAWTRVHTSYAHTGNPSILSCRWYSSLKPSRANLSKSVFYLSVCLSGVGTAVNESWRPRPLPSSAGRGVLQIVLRDHKKQGAPVVEKRAEKIVWAKDWYILAQAKSLRRADNNRDE